MVHIPQTRREPRAVLEVDSRKTERAKGSRVESRVSAFFKRSQRVVSLVRWRFLRGMFYNIRTQMPCIPRQSYYGARLVCPVFARSLRYLSYTATTTPEPAGTDTNRCVNFVRSTVARA